MTLRILDKCDEFDFRTRDNGENAQALGHRKSKLDHPVVTDEPRFLKPVQSKLGDESADRYSERFEHSAENISTINPRHFHKVSPMPAPSPIYNEHDDIGGMHAVGMTACAISGFFMGCLCILGILIFV